MKKMLKKMLGTVLAVTLVAGTVVFPGMTASAAEAIVVFSDNFDSYADMAEGVYASGTASQDETVALSPNNHTWDSTKWFYNYERAGRIGVTDNGGARVADGKMEIRRKQRYMAGGYNTGAALRIAEAGASVGKNKYVVQFDMANNINPTVRSGDEADVSEVAFVFSAQKGSSTVNFAYGATQFDLFKVKQTGKLYVTSYDDANGKTETETNIKIEDSTTDFKTFRVEFDASTYNDGIVSWKVYVDGVLAGTGSDTRTEGSRMTNGIPQGFAFGSFIPEDAASDPTVVLTGTDPKNSAYIDNVIVVKATDADNNWFDTGVKNDAYFVASKTAEHGLTDGSAVSIVQMQTGRNFSGTVEVVDAFTVKVNHNFATNPVGGNYTLTFADGSTAVCARNAVVVAYAEHVFSDDFDSYADMASGVHTSGTAKQDETIMLSPYNHTWDETKWFFNYERDTKMDTENNGGARVADGMMEIWRKQRYMAGGLNSGAALRIAEAGASVGKNKYVVQFDMANNINPTVRSGDEADVSEVAFVFSAQKGSSTVNFAYGATQFDLFKVKQTGKLYVISYDDANGKTEAETNITIADSTTDFKTFRVEFDASTYDDKIVSWKVYVDGVLAGTGSDTRTDGTRLTNGLPQGFAFGSFIPEDAPANDPTVVLTGTDPKNSAYIDNVVVMKTTGATGATWFDTGAKNDGYFTVSSTMAHGAINGEAVAIVSEQTGKSYTGTIEVVDPYTVKVKHNFASNPVGGNYTLTFSDGTSVVCERKGISGSVTTASGIATITYKNTGASDVSAYLFYALYDGSKLADVKMKDVTLLAGTGAIDAPYSACTVTVPAANTTNGTASTEASTVSADGKTVKAFFWAKSNIAPLLLAK